MMKLKALILAAGKGVRQKTNGDCKPLVKVLGLTLLERTIISARSCGIRDFCIVTGFNDQKIKKYFKDGKNLGVNIQYIKNEQWERGNGISVLKAEHLFNETFMLLMADHIFDPGILNKLLATKMNDDECLLCVDDTFPSHLNMEDATKVLTENRHIANIGKNIKNFNCIDIGIFKCNRTIFDALRKSINNKGDESLSGGVKILAQNNKMKYMLVDGNYWIDVDDPQDLENAEMILTSKLKKETDGPISKHLNRPISLKISKWLLNTRITPNQMTLISFAIGLTAAAMFFEGSYLFLVLGGILVHLHSVLDGCDGEIARLKIQKSKYGGWLDSVLDRYVDAAIIMGLTFGHWNATNENFVWILGFVALIGSFLNSYTGDKYDSIFTRKQKNFNTKKIRIGRDLRLLIVTIGALTNMIPVMLIVLACIANFEALRRIISFKTYLEEPHILSSR